MRPIHPGEILREEFLVPLEITAHALSQAIRVPATRVNDIVNGKRGITADTALRLARYFGNSPEFWLNLQAAYDLHTSEHEVAAKIEREVSPRVAADARLFARTMLNIARKLVRRAFATIENKLLKSVSSRYEPGGRGFANLVWRGKNPR